MITLYIICYNEEPILPFAIKHYRERFPNCRIVIYDNESTDRSVEIANSNNCEVISFSTNGTFSDGKHLDIKNNCWKDSTTNWNIVCDCDELVDINQNDIIEENKAGTNIITFDGYSIVNYDPETTLEDMKFGYYDPGYSKPYMFNKKYIKEINYEPGAHKADPIAHVDQNVKNSVKTYKALHYKYLYPQYTIDRYKLCNDRLSEENIKNGWGIQYKMSKEDIINLYNSKRDNLIRLIYE
jgi:hypothetical protein